MFYFERLGPSRFRASKHVGGGWNTSEQHVAPAFGLLAHAIETDHRSGPDEPLRLSRISYDILGTLPIGIVDVEIDVIRPGRTIELVEARLLHQGRAAVVARAWFLTEYDTALIAGTALPSMPPPETMARWEPASIWPGGFVQSIEARRTLFENGKAASWVRTDTALVRNETVSSTARALGMIDMANGLAPRVNNSEFAFPNVDLTVHLFATPLGDWVGLDTAVSFGAGGLGLTFSTIHDAHGVIGTVAQCLTVRPKVAASG